MLEQSLCCDSFAYRFVCFCDSHLDLGKMRLRLGELRRLCVYLALRGGKLATLPEGHADTLDLCKGRVEFGLRRVKLRLCIVEFLKRLPLRILVFPAPVIELRLCVRHDAVVAPLRDFRMDEDIVLAQHVFLADIVYAISLPILLLFIFIIGIYYFNQPDRRKLQRDSIIALALIALFSFCECSVKQWFCDWPVLWQHLALICIYLLPIATNQVIYDIVENKYKPLIKHIQHACAVLAVVALCSEVLGFHGLDYGMFGYYLLLLVCQTAVIRTLWQSARGGNPYSYAMFPPCLVLSLLAVFDGMNMNAQWFMGPFYLMPLGAVTLLSFVLVIVKDQLDRERRLESSAIQLEAQAARAVERSEIDPLTGCLNRNAYDKILAHEVKLKDPSFCLVMLDIDHFKLVNDSFGHDAGDQVLRRVTETVREHISHQMKFFRWGGEEFVIYCPQMSRLEAAEVAELLRVAVVDARILPQQPVTISLGVASWHGEQDDLDAMFRRLDSALYRAKRTGRNRVEIE